LEETKATYSDAWLKEMGVSENLISYYQKAIAQGEDTIVKNFHNTFKKWREDYDIANDKGKKAEHDLIVQIADKLVENIEKQLEQQEELAESINEANERLIDKMQQQIDAQRQARENDEKEDEITDLYNQLAYLSADASGASVLEQIALEKEIAEAEQEYRDTLVD
jgi:glutamyl-tRNA reductase